MRWNRTGWIIAAAVAFLTLFILFALAPRDGSARDEMARTVAAGDEYWETTVRYEARYNYTSADGRTRSLTAFVNTPETLGEDTSLQDQAAWALRQVAGEQGIELPEGFEEEIIVYRLVSGAEE